MSEPYAADNQSMLLSKTVNVLPNHYEALLKSHMSYLKQGSSVPPGCHSLGKM